MYCNYLSNKFGNLFNSTLQVFNLKFSIFAFLIIFIQFVTNVSVSRILFYIN